MSKRSVRSIRQTVPESEAGLKSILVVEDDRDLSTLVQRAIQRLAPDTRIVWATNADEAEGWIQARSFSLIILDHHLPGLRTGLDVFDSCQRVCPKTPVLMMSGMQVADFLQIMAGRRNVPPFLPKPFEFEELVNMVKSALYVRERFFEIEDETSDPAAA